MAKLNYLHQLELLARVAPIKVEDDADGNWNCRFEGVMIHRGEEIITAHHLWAHNAAAVVDKFFNFVTKPGISLYVIETGRFYSYNISGGFVHVGGYITL